MHVYFLQNIVQIIYLCCVKGVAIYTAYYLVAQWLS